MSDLVDRLLRGEHPVEITVGPERTVKRLQECIEKGYVHLKFTGTRGGTDLYVPLQSGASDLSAADFANGRGRLKLVGELVLDYVPLKCIAEIDLATMAGQGHMERLD